MSTFKHDIGLRVVKLFNTVLMAVPFAASWLMYYSNITAVPYEQLADWLIIAVLFGLYVVFGRVYDAFLVSINRISEMVYSQCLSAFISDCIMYAITCLLTVSFANPLPLLAAFGGQILISVLWCVIVHKWYFKAFAAQRTAVIYDERGGLDKLISQYGLRKKFDIQVTAEVDECLDKLDMLKDMQVVFLSGVHSHDRNIILKYCVKNGITVYVIPRIGDTLMSGAKRIHMLHLPMLRVGRYCPNPEYLFIKRAFDIISSSLVLLLVSPILAITALAIKLTDGGPVFYKQCRLTRDGKRFMVLKFRSMRVDAEKDGVARLSTGDNDDRITPVGRIIRKVRIDELPQLFNILGGSMSVVGPRPERPEIAEQYMEEMPEFELRLQAKAGLTGYAQVYGKYNISPYDKLQMDLMYISNPNILEDLRIIFATVKILFMPDSTEGVAVGQTTASTASAAPTADAPEKEKETAGVR